MEATRIISSGVTASCTPRQGLPSRNSRGICSHPQNCAATKLRMMPVTAKQQKTGGSEQTAAICLNIRWKTLVLNLGVRQKPRRPVHGGYQQGQTRMEKGTTYLFISSFHRRATSHTSAKVLHPSSSPPIQLKKVIPSVSDKSHADLSTGGTNRAKHGWKKAPHTSSFPLSTAGQPATPLRKCCIHPAHHQYN